MRPLCRRGSLSVTNVLFPRCVRPLSVSPRRERVIRSKYADVRISDQSYFEFVWSRASEFGERPALVDAVTYRTLTYAESRAQSLSLASELSRRGAKRGDVMAILLPNCVEYPLVFSGANGAGLANTTLNPMYTPNEIAKQLKATSAKWAVTTQKLLPKLKEAATKVEGGDKLQAFIVGENTSDCPSVEELLTADGDESLLPLAAMDVDEDICVLPFSSGTTGVPKGVVLTHRNIVGNICQAMLGPEEVQLVRPPKGT